MFLGCGPYASPQNVGLYGPNRVFASGDDGVHTKMVIVQRNCVTSTKDPCA